MPEFLLNYGGPSGWFADQKTNIEKCKTACLGFYGNPNRQVSYKIKGINATVYTYGVHRALLLELPRDASSEARGLFFEIRNDAKEFGKRKYCWLSNNCVTAVAHALHRLNSDMTSKNIVLPWSLDSKLTRFSKKYYDCYQTGTSSEDFIKKYQEMANKESFSFLRKTRWTKRSLNVSSTDGPAPGIISASGIIHHAYGKSGGTGERSKATLLELGWVTEDKNQILRPTEKAPRDFKKGLEKFNQDFEKVQKLKQAYQKEAGIFSLNARKFFNDNPDYETAIMRLQAQAQKNPNGASKKVLDALEPKQADLNPLLKSPDLEDVSSETLKKLLM